MSNLNLAIVGNGTWGGLLDAEGRLVWACLPRFDSDPIFPALLDADAAEEGVFAIELDRMVHSEQRYDGNTAIVVTVLEDDAGNALEIRDFAPRFVNFRRMFRPTSLIRRLRPVRGAPRIRIVVRPRCSYGSGRPELTRGSNHLRFVMPELTLRLTTDAPIAYVAESVPFVLERPLHLMLGPDESLSGPLEATARDFYDRTYEYWTEWSRTLSIPFEWQDAVIRAAITLKLCSFEESGAVIAALTTSVPEAADSGRNWDYRYCWLRDAYFVIHALNRLGATNTLEGYLGYLTNLVAGLDGALQPVYGIALEEQLTERVVDGLAGYRGMGPVRAGNQAFEHVQNDVYGSVVLAAAQAFFDRRLRNPGGSVLYERLVRIGEAAVARWDQPDAGLWELRTQSAVHTYSSVLCWAACDRLAKIATRLARRTDAAAWVRHAETIRGGILDAAWSEKRSAYTAAFGGEELDASMLLLHELGFLEAEHPRFVATVRAIEEELRRGNLIFRYANEDDFGRPANAFTVCTFWYIDALAAVGREGEARELFQEMLGRRNPLGLLSEDIDPRSGELWGNFPQTYSMVGLINSAMRLSIPWESAF